MYYADQPHVLEASTIDAVATPTDGPQVVTLADGRQALLLYVVLDPAVTGKTYGEGNPAAQVPFPTMLHVTNGTAHRLLPIREASDLPWVAGIYAEAESAATEEESASSEPAADTTATADTAEAGAKGEGEGEGEGEEIADTAEAEALIRQDVE